MREGRTKRKVQMSGVGCLFLSLALTAVPFAVLNSQDINAVIDFEGLPAGTILSSVNGSSGGSPVGPVTVNGLFPANPGPNSAVIFDSSNPTGGDTDLGTPNETFGGPGIGSAGQIGRPFQNAVPLGNILIVAEDLTDADMDGLVDDPDDGAMNGMFLDLDFSTISEPFVPADVTVFGITVLDNETFRPAAMLRLFDANDTLLFSMSLSPTGNNGVRRHQVGSPGVGISAVSRMEIMLNGSGAVDGIEFAVTPPAPPSCQIDPPGPFDLSAGTTVSFTVTGATQGVGETVVISATAFPLGAVMTPPLPLDSAPESSVSSVFEWTPDAVGVGINPVNFTVTDSLGQVTMCSTEIEVTLPPPPQCSIDPADSFAVDVGDSVSFTVTGETPEDGLTVVLDTTGLPPGATMTPNLPLDSSPETSTSSVFEWFPTGADVGVTEVTFNVTDSAGQVVECTATIEVICLLDIVGQPTDVVACEGASAMFAVEPAGAGPFSFQWRKDGADLPGENESTLVIDPVTPGDAGTYDVVVTNVCGSLTSDPALLTVLVAPLVTSHPDRAVACEGESVLFEVAVSGSPPLSFQWRRNNINIPGANAIAFSIDSVAAADAGSYDVVVSNDCGSVTSNPATLTVNLAPDIIVNPQSQELCPGDDLFLLVEATGTAPLTFQWLRNGIELPGEEGSTLMVSPVEFGNYVVEVTNLCATAESETAVITQSPAEKCENEFQRCDCNVDGICNVADGIVILRVLFQGLPGSTCDDACDHNDDGLLDVSDVAFILAYLFQDGPEPDAPFPDCGLDPTPDGLSCDASLFCL